jgi:hypothetical protein
VTSRLADEGYFDAIYHAFSLGQCLGNKLGACPTL